MNKKNKKDQPEKQILVVGLGASAGGLEALKDFFASLPEQTGMAFIVVLHLAPEKKSSLPEILQHETALKVAQVSGRTPIEADHVYIIPPDKMLSVEDSHLVLSQPAKRHGLDTINLLLRTLAEKKGKYAAGIILSGSGSDGTSGLQAIKEHEGFALVQDPDEAKSKGMPHSAIKTGVMDKVMPVKEMAKELMRYRETFSKISLPEELDEADSSETEQILSDIFENIRSYNGHDFGNYRRSSVLRRIGRRMRVVQVHTLTAYRDYLEEDPDEVEELFKDLLISVTHFFRDPDSFEALEKKVIPKLFNEKSQNEQLRVWVPGCATGEEAYSIAMLLVEYAEKAGHHPEIQVFASDVDQEALKKARQGRYPKSIEHDMSDERLHRFFKENGDEYLVKKELQDIILFASHDLLGNAPFSNQDLIACRNLLIYLNRDLQSEVFNLLYYSLRPAGWLFLGRSDSHIGTEGLFKTIDQTHHLYRQKPSSRTHIKLPDLPLLYKSRAVPMHEETPSQRKHNIEQMHWRILAKLFAPQSVLIDEAYNVIHATDGIARYLKYGGGEPSRNILDMARPEIRQSLRGILFKIKKSEERSAQQKIHVKLEEEDKSLEIIARSHHENHYKEGLIHVVFKEIDQIQSAAGKREQLSDGELTDKEAKLIESLEKELDYTKEQLQISIEQYETSNEELRTSNEELQSMNEELQSTSEELETSKEELQSVNEELQTVNDELDSKVHELSSANNDLQNLMEATEVGILFVDLELRVQRFTEASTEIFNLIPSDEGRPVDHITHALQYDDLIADIKQVAADFRHIKKVVTTGDDRHYVMRLRPYRSTQDIVEGVVLTFTEFTQQIQNTRKDKKQQEAVAELGVYALEKNDLEAILKRAIDISCIILKLECAVILAFDEQEGSFEIAAQAGCAAKKGPVQVADKWDIGYALKNEGPTVVKSYGQEQRFGLNPFLIDKEVESAVHMVVRGSEKTYGLLSFYSEQEYAFTDDKMAFLGLVANIVGLAMDRDRAEHNLRDANEQLQQAIKKSRQYQKDILNTSIADRWELGGFLHDNLAQMLASAKISVDMLAEKLADGDSNIDIRREIIQIDDIINDSLTNIRNLSHHIIPVDIEEEGVENAFRFLMRQNQKMYNLKYTLDMGHIIHEVKNQKFATHLYHVVQEAIKNAAVHGKAKNVMVYIHKSNDDLVLQVKDDGMGLSQTENDNNGKGIRLMQHRVELLGGALKIDEWQEDGESGTCVCCTMPLEKAMK